MDKPTAYISAYWNGELFKVPCWSSQEEIDGFLSREVDYYYYDSYYGRNRPRYKYPYITVCFDWEDIPWFLAQYLRGSIYWKYTSNGWRLEMNIWTDVHWNKQLREVDAFRVRNKIGCIVDKNPISKEQYEEEQRRIEEAEKQVIEDRKNGLLW